MSTFNFSYRKCFFCGRLCDDGLFINHQWYCLDCLDLDILDSFATLEWFFMLDLCIKFFLLVAVLLSPIGLACVIAFAKH